MKTTWEEKWDDFFGVFYFESLSGKTVDDYTIKDFIRQEIHQAKAEMLREIIEEFNEFNDGCGGCCTKKYLYDALQAKYPDLISTAGDGSPKTP